MSKWYIQNRTTGFFWDPKKRKWRKKYADVSAVGGFPDQNAAIEYVDSEMARSTADIRVVDNVHYDLTANDPEDSGELFAVNMETGKVVNSFPTKELFNEWLKSADAKQNAVIKLTKERP